MKSELDDNNTGEIIFLEKITSFSWHMKLKIPFYIELDMDTSPGYIIPLLLANNDLEKLFIKRSILWNYDMVRSTLEVIIHTQKDNEVWLEGLFPGKMIRYLTPEEIIIPGLNADHYYFIGSSHTQAFFYQFNRSLPFTKTVNSFIYSRHTGDFFPDIDGSYPLDYHVIYPYSPERILSLFTSNFTKANDNFIILLSGDHDVNRLLSHFFKKEWGATENQIKIFNCHYP